MFLRGVLVVTRRANEGSILDGCESEPSLKQRKYRFEDAEIKNVCSGMCGLGIEQVHK